MLSLQDKNTKLAILAVATAAVVVGVCMNNKKFGNKGTLVCVGLSVGVAFFVATNLKEEVVTEEFYAEEADTEEADAEEPVVDVEEPEDDDVQPRNDSASKQGPVDATPGPVKGPGCVQMDTVSPEDLLPNADSENVWDTPANPGDISGANFLDSGHHLGVNTVGQSLRNANRQLRSEPANPQVKVSPWLQTTIDPDCNRRPMEIGA